MDLTRLMRPASIAVVGATDRPGSYGAQALLNLDAIGFAGPVWGVNPGRSSVLGRVCVPAVAELPEAVDAVVVAIPAAGVAAAVDEAGARGCGGAVVFSAGFAEIGGGVGLQRDLIAAAARHRFPVCGPNCNGIVAMHTRAALWGDALTPREPGAVALISQSGNVAVNALATRRGLRFHTVVASGNQAVVSASDYLAFLAREDGVGAIALYLEDDGGPAMCDGLAACAESGVRVAVLKVGSSAAGADAAAAHSGALAGDQRIFRALIEDAGAVWADDLHELLELAKTLAVRRGSRARAGGVAIMTCSGGDSAQGADEAERLGVSLPAFAPATCDELRELLPAAATPANPLDYTAMIWGDTAALCGLVQAVGADPAVGRVLVFYDQFPDLDGAIKESWDAVREGVIAGGAVSEADTIVSSTLPELLDDDDAWRFIQAGIPAVAGLRTGLRCAAALAHAPGDSARLREIAALAQTASAPVPRRVAGRARRQGAAAERRRERDRGPTRRGRGRCRGRVDGARRRRRPQAERPRRPAQVRARGRPPGGARRGAGAVRLPRGVRARRERARRANGGTRSGDDRRRPYGCRRTGAGDRPRRRVDRGPRRCGDRAAAGVGRPDRAGSTLAARSAAADGRARRHARR
ncbi:MAG TPA: CoA-binding protein, partial [Solirubrobacteraceae bacterium]|nr:CoA-binding protein [Solirubrobacteraceae bacterium]